MIRWEVGGSPWSHRELSFRLKHPMAIYTPVALAASTALHRDQEEVSGRNRIHQNRLK